MDEFPFYQQMLDRSSFSRNNYKCGIIHNHGDSFDENLVSACTHTFHLECVQEAEAIIEDIKPTPTLVIGYVVVRWLIPLLLTIKPSKFLAVLVSILHDQF